MRKIPLFRSIGDKIKEDILKGVYSDGSILPSEKELCKKFNVSRITIRGALNLVAKSGLAVSVPGKGWLIDKKKKSKASMMDFGKSKQILFFSQAREASSLVFHGVSDSLQDKNITLKSFNLNEKDNENDWDYILREYEDHIIKADGIIAFADKKSKVSLSGFVNKINCPIILAGYTGLNLADVVSCDYKGGSMAMVKRLVEHGHRNIIYYCYDKVLQLIPSFKERLAGYREGMLDAGLKPEIIYHDYKIVTEKSFCDNFMEQLYFTKKHSSASRPSVTCIFASSNEQVKMLIPLLSQCGISVPGEISLCGYGNSNDNTLPSENGLTNICCVNEDWHELGKAVAGKMLSRLCGDDSVPSWTLIPCSILDGDTFCPNNQ